MHIRVKCYLTVEADDNDSAFEKLVDWLDKAQDRVDASIKHMVCEDDDDYEIETKA